MCFTGPKNRSNLQKEKKPIRLFTARKASKAHSVWKLLISSKAIVKTPLHPQPPRTQQSPAVPRSIGSWAPRPSSRNQHSVPKGRTKGNATHKQEVSPLGKEKQRRLPEAKWSELGPEEQVRICHWEESKSQRKRKEHSGYTARAQQRQDSLPSLVQGLRKSHRKPPGPDWVATV